MLLSYYQVLFQLFLTKEVLKNLKFRYAQKKQAWYYHTEPYRKKSKRELTLDEIRDMFVPFNLPISVDDWSIKSDTSVLTKDANDVINPPFITLSLLHNNGSTSEIIDTLPSNKRIYINDIVNILIDKGLLNAKGKLYRFDSKSNNISYQYTKRLIKIIQGLSIEQMMLLINIDVNYVLPYVVPIYNNDTDTKTKESIIIDCDSRCLNLFRSYYDQELYNKFYKVINKIYNEYLENIDKYDFNIDYNCVFDLFKVLFNKNIMTKNNAEKITLFMGISLLYKGKEGKTQESAIKLLSDLLSTAYNKEIKLNTEIYNIYSLEVFDDR